MIKNLVLIAVIYFVYRAIKSYMLKGLNHKPGEKVGERAGESPDDLMIKDPQCGVYFPKREGVSLNTGRETLYFCSEKCRDEYKKTH